jgi:alanyl-tRNA synthetase
VHDLDDIAVQDNPRAMLRAGNDVPVNFDSNGSRREVEVLEQRPNGEPIGNFVPHSIHRDMHRVHTLPAVSSVLNPTAMTTEKLYWNDPFATTFNASGARLANFQNKPSMVLAQTLFYPEAGGQLADTGELILGERRLAVDDVQIDDSDVIHHLLASANDAAAAFENEAPVTGTINARRRRDHMAQHTAQHMLSRTLLDEARAETMSSRLGASVCTIDLGRAAVSDAELARAEDAANSVIQSDVTVRAYFPTPEELATLPLRRAPKVAPGTRVRVIDIEGFDVSPCGGTHCTRTGQIGLVRIVGTEKYKGMLRVSFHAAGRALNDMREKESALAALARDFTCAPLDVNGAVAKLRADLKARLDALSVARGELVAFLAEKTLSAHSPDPSGTTRVLLVRAGDDIGMLRTLAARLAARPDVVAFCASRAGSDSSSERDMMIVVQRGDRATFDCGGWLKAAAESAGGRGGGRPERAEGRLPESASLTALIHGAGATAVG